MNQRFQRTAMWTAAVAGLAAALLVLPAAALAQSAGEVADGLPPLEEVAPISELEALAPPWAEIDSPVFTGSLADGETAKSSGSSAPESASAPAVPGGDAENARTYCANIADAAADARYARQAQALADMEEEIRDRIRQLEEKRAEYEKWLARREDFLRKADDSVVAIFTQMRPDAASQQMMAMSMEAAAAILVKLKPRTASAILNEMDPARAAMLTTTMAGLANPSDEEQTPG